MERDSTFLCTCGQVLEPITAEAAAAHADIVPLQSAFAAKTSSTDTATTKSEEVEEQNSRSAKAAEQKAAERKVLALEKDVAAVLIELECAHRAAEDTRGNLSAEIAQLSEALEKARAGGIALAQERDALKQSIAAVTPREPPNGRGVGELQSSQEEVAGLVKVQGEQEERIKELQQEVKNKEQYIQGLQLDVQDKTESASKLNDELQSTLEEVAGLVKVQGEQEKRIKGLQQDVKDKDETELRLTGELQTSQDEVAGLVKVRDEQEERIKGLQQEVKDKQQNVAKLTGELQSSQDEVAGLIKARDEKEECIKGLQQEGQGKDASMHVASFVQDAFPSFLSDQLKSEREESSSEPIPAPSRALPLRSNLVQLPKNNGRFERDAAARESVTSEATEVHADVVAALAAATLKIEELESQLLLQHERAEAYDGRDLAVHAAVHASALHLAAPTSAAAQTATHQIHGLHYVADATAFVRDAVMTWREKDSAKSTSGISSGRRDGDDGDDAALTSAVTESAVAEGYKQSSKERYNCDAPQACAEKDVWSDIWMFDQVSSPTGILHVRSLMESVRHECGQAALVYILTSTPPLPY